MLILTALYAVIAVFIYLLGAGSLVTRCTGLYQAANDACQAAYVASLPWWQQVLGTPVPAIAFFVIATVITFIVGRRFRRGVWRGDVEPRGVRRPRRLR